MTKKIALFPGSFDPFTLGHLDTVVRASKLFDEVIIAIMTNTNKAPLFTSDERVALATEAVAGYQNVNVVAGATRLTVDYALELGAHFIIRGIRNVKDFEYERDIAAMNQTQNQSVETVFLVAAPKYSFLSSSMIKEIAKFKGDINGLVPQNVAIHLQEKYSH